MTLIAEIGGIPPAIIEYPLTVRDLAERHPLIGWPDDPTVLTFEDTDWNGHWYTVVAPTPQPALAWGERAVEVTPVNDAGTWRQAWTVESITVENAKARTRQLAIAIYWDKMYAVPTEQEMINGLADPAQITTARVTRLRPKLNEVRTRIAAIPDGSPTGVQDAYAIYLELEALA